MTHNEALIIVERAIRDNIKTRSVADAIIRDKLLMLRCANEVKAAWERGELASSVLGFSNLRQQ